MSWSWTLLVAFAFVCLDCGGHATMRSAPNFSGRELRHRTVLVLPIAVTDDYGDERTGVILDRETREEVTRMACRSAADGQRDLALTCFDSPTVTGAASVSDAVPAEFTRDQPANATLVRTRGYTLSAVLVDLRAGTEVRAAVRSGEGSTKNENEMPVDSVLHGIMKALLADLLDH